MELDKDLASQQEARNLITQANKAAGELAKMSQCQIDKIVAAISEAGQKNARRLAQMAAGRNRLWPGRGQSTEKHLCCQNRLRSH